VPVAMVLEELKPHYSFFIVSDQTAQQVKEIMSALPFKTENRLFTLKDYQSLKLCYEDCKKAIEAAVKLVGEENVYVNYTGGTKVMSAAVILAAQYYNVHCIYVGGDIREKGGLGTVIRDHEEIFIELSPAKKVR